MDIKSKKAIKYHKLINKCIEKLNTMGYDFSINSQNESGSILLVTSIYKQGCAGTDAFYRSQMLKENKQWEK